MCGKIASNVLQYFNQNLTTQKVYNILGNKAILT